jgi:formylglycine-generating enzyme required for sulfatase activity
MGDIQGDGYSHEQPVYSVYVNKFAMGKFEVTFAEATTRTKPDDES